MNERIQSAQELKDHLGVVQKTVYDWQGRWTLGLMIANGTALATVTAAILRDVSSPIVYLIFPCVWMFGLGLITSGATPALDIFRFEREIDRTLERLAALEQTPPAPIKQQFGGISRMQVLQMWWLEIAASAFFLAGLVYPMCVLFTRYLEHRDFTGA